MEDGAIVPEVVGRWGQISFGDIGYSPVDLCRCRGAQSLFVYVDGGLRDIEDGEIFVAAEEKATARTASYPDGEYEIVGWAKRSVPT